ncbi:ABC-type glycerol-3-phosphate transport system substrate-binding protein [Pullulanibacillus pueri]|uniref:Extracellular solute-binding protein n=1 Tax=Pullulanibacillus pueri TaxID=1437324 RepID=A0A8J2ZWL3_9BACL|nr:extracellular solute-binding protein [Pullulanibacillus pueri]MBM7680918.1 ABC-type glycerol-3-phosphate transport system substrate-binding protein [Pullulanibacillus pueri]GGH81330.1 hypothetical protein GCM10007096_19070 [Pullulanibacillus pueri]
MKHKFIVILTFLLLCSLLMAGCSSKETSKKTTADVKPIVTDPDTFPIVKDKVTLTVLIPSNSLVKDFNTNDFTKWYEKKTGVHVKWEIIPEDGAAEKLNLMLASGDLPDVIMHMPVTKSQLMVYGKKGVFQSLNNLIDKYGLRPRKCLMMSLALKMQ